MTETAEPGDAGLARRPLARLRMALRRVTRNRQLILLLLAVVIGAGAAALAILFRELYLAIQLVTFATGSEALYHDVHELADWRVVAVPAVGGLLIGLFVRYAMPGRRPHGVADVIESVARRSGAMNGLTGLGAALVSAASIGVGASVGREGPVVHLGAAMSSALSERLGLSRTQTVTLVGCGVAAAVSASFNAPIAGVFFALEVVIGHYALSAFAPIVLASVIGTILSRIYFGDYPAFIIPGQAITSFLEFPAFAILGVVSAAAAIVFLRSIALAHNAADRVAVPDWLKPAIGGLAVGLIAIWLPQILGVGYGATDDALRGDWSLWMLIALAAAKTAATAISFGFGFGGGVFSPSLFLGAMVGGAFAGVAADILPDYASGSSVYSLVGMGSVAGAVLGAPISTILIVFELTGDYAVTTAVMVGVAIASLITTQVFGKSFFHWQLAQRGISLEGGREAGLVEAIRVADLMKTDFAAVPLSTGMRAVRAALQEAPHGELFVVEDGERLVGTITLTDLSEMAFDTSHDHLLNAGDVARLHPPVLDASDSLTAAFRLMQTVGEEHIGVVTDHDTMRLVGFVHELDVILAYNRALMQAREEERGGG